MKSVLKHIVKMSLIVILWAMIGTILLTVAYALPSDVMAKNVVASEAMLRAQDDEATFEKTGYYDMYDTGTNIIILHEIIYPNSKHPFRDALLNPTADYFKGNLSQWIDNVVKHGTDRLYTEEDQKTYPRYWHGYLVLLKPLFLLFNLKWIYGLNLVVLALLNIYILYLLAKCAGKFSVAYLLFICVMNPLRIALSFQLSAVFYALTLSMILLLKQSEKSDRNESFGDKNKIYYIFLFDGMMVAFFDFLTYPMVAYAVLLLTYVLLDSNKDLLHQFVEAIRTGLSFLFGYGGLWFMKWVIASVFTDQNVILDGIANTMHRVGAKEMSEDVLFDATPLLSITSNIKTFLNWKTVLFFAVVVLFVIAVKLLKKTSLWFQSGIILPALVVALSPLLWYVVVYNHCALHPHLEWREFGISFYALSILLISLVEKRNQNENGQ